MKKFNLVCIIDDDDVFQFSTKKILDSSNLVDNVIQFGDGEKAIEYFIENKTNRLKLPDLVFLDLNMPYMDGWQFLDEYIANEFEKNQIVIYLCTSSISTLDMAKFYKYSQLEGYLTKPIMKKNVFQVLEKQIEKFSH